MYTKNEPTNERLRILELFNGLKAWRQPCGYIYLLRKNGVVIYVGQTVNLTNRIKTHRSTKDFDLFDYCKVYKEKMDEVEAIYILRFKPLHNSFMAACGGTASRDKLMTSLGRGVFNTITCSKRYPELRRDV